MVEKGDTAVIDGNIDATWTAGLKRDLPAPAKPSTFGFGFLTMCT